MKILTRYFIKEFLKPLIFSITAFSGLVMISEFFRELSFYLEKKTAFGIVFSYLFLNLPWWMIQVLPVSVLLAVLFSLGQMSRQGEITAMKAAGISLWRLIIIFLSCGAFIGAADITLREKVVPFAVVQAEKIRLEKIKAEPPKVQTQFFNLVVSMPPNGRITIGYLNIPSNLVQKVVIDYYDDAFNLQRQIVAASGRWVSDTTWALTNAVERMYSSETWKEDFSSEKTVSLPFQPNDFIINRVRPEQMTTAQYRQHLKQIETLGIPAEKEKIDFHLRLSSAFSHIIVMLIGIPFALGLGSRYGRTISFTFALIFAFVYWGVQAVGQSLGENKIISPLLAAWLGNILFGIAGIFLIGKLQK